MTENLASLVPRLETARLVLREYRRDDFEPFVAHVTDPESTVHLTTSDRPGAWRIFTSHAGMWVLWGAGWWTMALRDTGETVGGVGAFYRDGEGGLEIGWHTWRGHWGKGFASEAAAAVLKHAFEVRRVPKIHALISAGNASSIRVAERIGLAYEGERMLHDKPIGVYSRAQA